MITVRWQVNGTCHSSDIGSAQVTGHAEPVWSTAEWRSFRSRGDKMGMLLTVTHKGWLALVGC